MAECGVLQEPFFYCNACSTVVIIIIACTIHIDEIFVRMFLLFPNTLFDFFWS